MMPRRWRGVAFPTFSGGFIVHFVARAGFALAVLALLSACGSTSTETPAAAVQVAPVVSPAYAGLPSGSLGQALDAASRTAANKAEAAALSSGERKTWRGENGAYGYIETGSASGDCREITHTVYVNGRPNVGKGTACKSGESWKLNG
jgi:surface antigen